MSLREEPRDPAIGRLISQRGNCIPKGGSRLKMNIMKKHNQSVVLAGICASAFCAASAQAQPNQVTPPATDASVTSSWNSSPTSRFYIGADAGGVITPDTRVKGFLGGVDPNTKVRLDPGVRFGFVGGYKLTDWFSVEAETGVYANNIKSITGADIRGDATLANIPFLLNARFEIPHGRCPITPYLGGGAGGSASVLSFDHHIDFNGERLHGSDAAPVFAYQAFAGLRYAINDRMGLGVEYHYFATTGPTWSADHTGGAPSDHISFLGTQNHAISVAFDYRF
jgi:opacity protein-like surface antigen